MLAAEHKFKELNIKIFVKDNIHKFLYFPIEYIYVT
jgi:hypothetical protein